MSTAREKWERVKSHLTERRRRSEREMAREAIGPKPTYLHDQAERDRWTAIKAYVRPETPFVRASVWGQRKAPSRPLPTTRDRQVMRDSTRAKRARADRAAMKAAGQ